MTSDAALWAAVVAILTFAGKLVFDVEVKRYDYWELRRSAIGRFRTDLELTLKDLDEQLPTLRASAYRDKMTSLIRWHAKEGLKFRMFGAEATDTKAQDEISAYFITLPARSQRLIAEAILRDRQMRALYRGMQTEDFERMTEDRQVEAFEQWLLLADKVAISARAVADDIKHWSINRRTLPGRLFGWDPEAGLSDPSIVPRSSSGHSALLGWLMRQRARGG